MRKLSSARQSLAETLTSPEALRFAPYYGMFFFWMLGTGAQQLARPLFAHQLGASPFLVLLITAFNAVAQVTSSPMTGFLADRLGRKPLVLIGNLIRGISCVGQFFVQTYWQFFILEFCGAIGVAMWATSSTVVMADVTSVENRGRLLALRGMSSAVGTMLGPISVARSEERRVGKECRL